MSFWRGLFGLSGGDKRKTGIQSALSGSGRTTASQVTFETAMNVSAFWACTRLLTEAVAAMPLVCYEFDSVNNIRKVKTDYDLARLMSYKPNRYQTRTEFFETIMLNLVTHGNAYIAVERSASGKVFSLLPLMSAQVLTKLQADGSIIYEESTANGNIKVYSDKSIWHIKLFGNGIIGMSPLDYAKAALGINIALENRMTTLSSNGGKTNGILTIDAKITNEQREKIRANFKELETGDKDQLFVLEAGMTYQQTSLSPSDMQLIENRRFSVEDIARFMGVPSVLINDTGASTTWGSGIEQIMEGFYKLNLRPYLERIESSLMRALIPEADWGKIEIEFDFDALLRADAVKRFESHSKSINAGLLTPNEARAKEGLEPKTGGDVIYLNGSLVPAGSVNRGTQAPKPS
jgi:HK97 family phage portal protein